jgi:hypothetical protein
VNVRRGIVCDLDPVHAFSAVVSVLVPGGAVWIGGPVVNAISFRGWTLADEMAFVALASGR